MPATPGPPRRGEEENSLPRPAPRGPHGATQPDTPRVSTHPLLPRARQGPQAAHRTLGLVSCVSHPPLLSTTAVMLLWRLLLGAVSPFFR